MKIINCRVDLRQYIDNVLTNRTFNAPIEEMIEELTSTIWWMSTPRLGEDWSCFFDNFDWDKLITQIDRWIESKTICGKR
jgi:hypothetical protein